MWLECPTATDLRSTLLSYIFDALFRDTPLGHVCRSFFFSLYVPPFNWPQLAKAKLTLFFLPRLLAIKCTHHKYQSSNLDHDLIRPFQNVGFTFHQSLDKNRYWSHILLLSSSVKDGLQINLKKLTLPLFSFSFLNHSALQGAYLSLSHLFC